MAAERTGDRELEYAQIRRRLVRSVQRVCPAWLRGRADDIVQNAVIRVLEISRTHESGAPHSSSYLWKVAYSAVVDEIRLLRRRPEVAWKSPDRGESDSEDPPDPAGPEADLALDELGAASEACLATLPQARRSVIGLHLLGYSAGEIAASLGWGEKRVRNLLYRGLVALRRCLAGKGFGS